MFSGSPRLISYFRFPISTADEPSALQLLTPTLLPQLNPSNWPSYDTCCFLQPFRVSQLCLCNYLPPAGAALTPTSLYTLAVFWTSNNTICNWPGGGKVTLGRNEQGRPTSSRSRPTFPREYPPEEKICLPDMLLSLYPGAEAVGTRQARAPGSVQ